MIKKLNYVFTKDINESTISDFLKDSETHKSSFNRLNKKTNNSLNSEIISEEEKLKIKFKEIEKITNEHIKKYSSLSLINPIFQSSEQNEKYNKSKNVKNQLSSINLALSKNYILKHKNTGDYNTLSTLSNLNKPTFQYQKKQVESILELNTEITNQEKLWQKLMIIKNKTFAVLKAKQISDQKLFDLNKIKNQLHNDLIFVKSHYNKQFDRELKSSSKFIPLS